MATNLNSSPTSSGMGELADARSSDPEIDDLSGSLASNEDSAVSARKRKNLANIEPDIKKLKLNYGTLDNAKLATFILIPQCIVCIYGNIE